MFEQNNICPYTGLRSFNEEESLYFEGRGKQITEITKLLEKNKFLMVTGASGDGKSSIVYAGIIPNARAGFFKAKFPKWVIADFRPEKSPLKNFAYSLSKALHLPNPESVETEIKRGFSSLIDLYKNSIHYVDQTNQEWEGLDDAQRREKIKQGANLMILVDQFEEFFTTKENFHDGTPSQNSQVTLNLILETAKISLKENIPIYVVCTMRSDYIGQCSAFRGLPEYIGFSQFFVPRLKRNQLQEVIETPAALNGNEISRRLVERLIYDLNEGIDQLPILQHALNQIWHLANDRNEKMDLIHYAMAGGMPVDELPPEDQEKFRLWFKDLPDYQKKSFESPSLQSVLDIHANKLYEGAAEAYNKTYPDQPVHPREAKRAIALTFASLSKIDEGRGVRNRMSLQEITNIINNPNLDTTKTGRLLNIFRQEGNTFIRPFIDEDGGNIDLDPENVLDITHESLIRNWKKLKEWAWKETEYYDTFIDFKKQLDRWIENDKSSSFLLPVGPLGYFEKWWEECKPNVYWINRYQDNIEDPEERLNSSVKILDDSKAFLTKSAKKHFLPKLFMKYGAGKIGIALAIILTIALSSFYYTDALKKQNDRVIEKVYSTAEKYINNEELLLDFNRSKANFLRSALVHNPTRSLNIIRNIEDPRLKLEIPIETYKELLLYTPKFPGYELDSLVDIIDRSFLDIYANGSLTQGQLLRNTNLYTTLLGHNLQFRPEEDITPSLVTQTENIYQLLLQILSGNPSTEPEISELIYKGIQHINNFNAEPKEKLEQIILLISPFEETGKNNFEYYFPKAANMSNGGDRLSHLGAHHLMAEVYASIGDQEKMYRAINELIKNNNAFTYTYELSFNSIYQIFGYLLINDHQELTEDFLDYVKRTFNIDRLDFILSFIDRAGYNKHFHLTNFRSEYNNNAGKVNPILSHLSLELMHSFFDFSIGISGEFSDPDERNFYQAVLLKNKALFTNKYLSDKGETIPVQSIDQWLKDAFKAYEKIRKSYLKKEQEWSYRYHGVGQRKTTMTNQAYFLYPDVFTGFNGDKYLNGYFIEFLSRNPQLLSFYNSLESYDILIDWVHHGHEYHHNINSDLTRMVEEISLTHLENIYDFIQKSGYADQLDLNLLNLLISNHYFKRGEMKLGTKFYADFDFSSVKSSAARFDYLDATFLYNELVKSAGFQAIHGNKEEVEKIIELIPQEYHIIKSYLIIAKKVHHSNHPEYSFHYIRKAFDLIDAADENTRRFRWQYFRNIIETLSEFGSKDMDKLVDEQIKPQYPFGTQDKVMGIIRRGKYYEAFNTIPASNTMMDDLNSFETFMIETNDHLDLPKWKGYKDLVDRYGFMGNDYIRFFE